MKKLPIGISNFETIIKENYLYVDKTQLMHQLFATGKKYFFLARPRRFGKTLLLSTLKAFFEGKRELFKGLWIDSSDYTWESYPVISLDFSTLSSDTPEELKKELIYELESQAELFSIDISQAPLTPIGKLKGLIKKLAKKNKIVILIDEYDYPIVGVLDNDKLAKENLKIINNFFTALKGHSEHFHAMFVTGVSPIPKTSIKSGMSILDNISLDSSAATLLGYTKEEIDTYFSKNIEELAHVENRSLIEIQKDIQDWYNGYRFSKIDKKVYNPFSLHYLFTKNEFDNYWFDVATPQFLRHFLEIHNYDLKALGLDDGSFIANSLRTLSIDSLRPDLELGPLLFQAGYLTISSYDKETNSYSLQSPNREVKESYAILLMASLAHTNESIINKAIRPIRNALFTNDMNELCLQLRIIFAQIPYHILEHNENFYHSLVQSFFHFLGFESQSEIITNRGRIDMVVFTKKFIYVFEFKVKKEESKAKNSPEEAADQVEDRMYYERFLTSPKAEKKSAIVIVGLTFSKIPGEPSVACDPRVLS